MPGTEGLFKTLLSEGGDAGKQLFLWGVLFSVIQQAAAPLMRDLQYLVNDVDPNVVLSPADLADMVVRGILEHSDAEARARKSGTSATQFADMVHNAGEPPGLQSVLEWWRRGFIDFGTPGPTKANVANAIATSRVYTYWTTTIKKAQFSPPSVAEAVNAVLRNQISLTEGIALAYFAGLGVHELHPPAGADTTDTATAFKVLLDTVGNPPSLTELLEMWRRGLIQPGDLTPKTAQPTPTALTFSQGIFEGDHKDKWLPLYAKLKTQFPTLFYIKDMIKAGTITKTVAQSLLSVQGYPTDVNAAILATAQSAQVATYKKLTESIIVKLYEERVITRTQAKTLFGYVGYGVDSATFILTAIDATLSLKQTNAAITRVRSLYLARKLDQTAASAALSALGVTGTAAKTTLKTWSLERSMEVTLLTSSEIAGAFKYTVMDQTEAMTALIALGYTPYDAWVRLSVEVHGALPTKPAKGPSPAGNIT